MAKLLTEVFNIKNGKLRKQDGTEIPIAYIDSQTSENTYQYKDEIKKFGAKWLKSINTWGWFTNNNPEVYHQFIEPCLKYLMSVEQNPNNESRDIISIIDELLKEISSGSAAETFDSTVNGGGNVNDIKAKLEEFKRELMSIMSDAEFKEKMLPIIKFRNAQGHQFSLINAILVIMQDPKATMVKSKSRWGAVNRMVKPNAPRITLWLPYGGKSLSKEEKAAITRQFLTSRGVSTVKELTPGDKEELDIQLKPKDGLMFKLAPNFYDIRFTDQMEGKDDLVGSNDIDLPWYDDKGEVTETTVQYCEALLNVIRNSGVQVRFVKDLGGARGVSKSGVIEVLQDAPQNSGLFNTLAHEFAHEMLHQRYLQKDKDNPNGYATYFVGTSQGRGAVEQQAELCAWIVLRNFGFDMPTNINYVGMWGMDDKAAPYVFDSVAGVATRMITDINKQVDNTVTESVEDGSVITGLEVAEMVGCEDVYLQNKKANQEDEQSRIAFRESFEKVLNQLNNRNQAQPFRL